MQLFRYKSYILAEIEKMPEYKKFERLLKKDFLHSSNKTEGKRIDFTAKKNQVKTWFKLQCLFQLLVYLCSIRIPDKQCGILQ